MEKALYLPASPFPELSPLPAPRVHPPKHQETTVQGDHPWACKRRWDNVNIVFEMSYGFLQAGNLSGAWLSIGPPARDAAGWVPMVGQKAMWELLAARGLGHGCRTVLRFCGWVKSCWRLRCVWREPRWR